MVSRNALLFFVCLFGGQLEGRKIYSYTLTIQLTGTVMFIAALYSHEMLSTKIIMVDCFAKLVNKTDEFSIECLSKLLFKVGAKLERHCSKVQNHLKYFEHKLKLLRRFIDGKFIYCLC